MASGKKGKKTKGKTIALTDFLGDSPNLLATQPIRKSTNWADEVDEYDGYESRKVVNVVLPTAPKSSRDVEDIGEQVPKEPPYIAYLSNLPYDVDEEEIEEFFKNMKIAGMRIPKEDRIGEAPRLKGFGYVEFEDRDSLIHALVLPDTTLKSRRIRIEVATNADNDRRRGRMDMGRDRSFETSGDWRSGPRVESAEERRGGAGGAGVARGEFTRDGMREAAPDRPFTRDGMRERGPDRELTREGMGSFNSGGGGGGFSRDRGGLNRDREGGGGFSREGGGGFGRDREGGGGFSRDREGGGGFSRDREGGGGFSRDREGGGGFGRDREGGGGFSRDREGGGGFSRDREGGGFGRRDGEERGPWRDAERGGGGGGREYNREPERDGGAGRERPKLQLAPRSKPVESTPSGPPKAEAPSSASIFGNAKPVDTAQREREIEEKLKEQQEKMGDLSRDRRDQDGSFDRSRLPRRPYESRSSPKDSRDNSYNRTNESRPSRGDSGRRDGSDSRSGDRDQPQDHSGDKREGDEGKATGDEQKSPDGRREKPKRDEKEPEMPKLQEPEPPNFTASNKFAFLQTEDDETLD